MKNVEKELMNIVYASDNHYFTYIYVSIKTLIEHNRNVVVYYLQQDVSQEHLKLLEEMSKETGVCINIQKFEMPAYFSKLPAFGTESKTTYAKLIFLSIFPELDRVLYLDPDTIVLGKLDELYFRDMKDNLIAGVLENLPYYHREAVGLKRNEPYINGGMVLCNLSKWRDDNFEEKSIIRLQDTSMNLNYDQGILNELCAGRIMVVEPQYNALAEIFSFKSSERIKARYQFATYYTQEELEEAVNTPVIVHFTHLFYGKPMSRKCTHPYTAYFQNIVKNSPLKKTLTDEDITIKAKWRKMVLEHMPFSFYLLFESVLDIRRKRDMYKGRSR